VSLTCPYCAAPVDPGAAECSHCGSALELPVSIGDLLDGRFEVRRVLGFGPLEGRQIQGCAMHLEVGLADDILYVTYPRVDGVTLREVLDARAAQNLGIAPEEALRLLLAIVSATSALHSATPHGALRPENIMLTPRGVVLTNGAIVGSVSPERIQPRLRAFARAVAYVAPEVAAGKKVTATADLFAIGAIAAELLSGTPSPHGLEEAGVSADLAASIRQLLDRDRTKRPGAQGTLLNGLSKHCGFDRRPPEPPLPTIEAPKQSEDEGGDSTTIAPAPTQKRESVAATPAPQPAMPLPAMPSVSRPAPPPTMQPQHPNHVQTQPTLPAARVGIGRPINAPGGAPPPPSGPGPARPSMPGPASPSIPARPRPSVPPAGAKSGTTIPPPAGGAAPSRPSIPGAAARPAMPSVPKLAGPGAPVAAPAPLGPAAPAPRVPRIPGIAGAPAPAPSAPAAPRPTPKRNLEDIDPKLLQAAQALRAEPVREFTDVDTGEIELIDD
jgi:serine/threonine protein kinase